MQVLIVDRIENYIAVCETEDGNFINVDINLLPIGIKEGSIILKDKNNKYRLSNDDEMKRRQKLFDIQNELSK